LTPEKHENQVMDIYLAEQDEVSFKVVGNCSVDITGNNVAMLPDGGNDDPEMYGEEDGSEGSDEEIDSELAGIEGSEGSEGEEDEEDSEEDAEMEFDAALMEEILKRKAEPFVQPGTKKAKITAIVEEEVVQKSKKQLKKERQAAAEESAKESQKKEVKKEVKEVKEVKKVAEPAEKAVSKTLPSGLILEDHVVGKGPQAKSGQKVSVRYIGKLLNGKVFDSNTKGAPFSFKLGKGEVIKGWDVGVQGMHVGGTRKITCPPAMAYGSRGAPPDIPKNATLTFEVKLLQIK
jgi:FK506-binding nuclear protein